MSAWLHYFNLKELRNLHEKRIFRIESFTPEFSDLGAMYREQKQSKDFFIRLIHKILNKDKKLKKFIEEIGCNIGLFVKSKPSITYDEDYNVDYKVIWKIKERLYFRCRHITDLSVKIVKLLLELDDLLKRNNLETWKIVLPIDLKNIED